MFPLLAVRRWSIRNALETSDLSPLSRGHCASKTFRRIARGRGRRQGAVIYTLTFAYSLSLWVCLSHQVSLCLPLSLCPLSICNSLALFYLSFLSLFSPSLAAPLSFMSVSASLSLSFSVSIFPLYAPLSFPSPLPFLPCYLYLPFLISSIAPPLSLSASRSLYLPISLVSRSTSICPSLYLSIPFSLSFSISLALPLFHSLPLAISLPLHGFHVAVHNRKSSFFVSIFSSSSAHFPLPRSTMERLVVLDRLTI